MKYKIVAAPKVVEGSPEAAARVFEQLINDNVVDGWRYHSMETITSKEKTGCSKNDITMTTLYLLIFVHD